MVLICVSFDEVWLIVFLQKNDISFEDKIWKEYCKLYWTIISQGNKALSNYKHFFFLIFIWSKIVFVAHEISIFKVTLGCWFQVWHQFCQIFCFFVFFGRKGIHIFVAFRAVVIVMYLLFLLFKDILRPLILTQMFSHLNVFRFNDEICLYLFSLSEKSSLHIWNVPYLNIGSLYLLG